MKTTKTTNYQKYLPFRNANPHYNPVGPIADEINKSVSEENPITLWYDEVEDLLTINPHWAYTKERCFDYYQVYTFTDTVTVEELEGILGFDNLCVLYDFDSESQAMGNLYRDYDSVWSPSLIWCLYMLDTRGIAFHKNPDDGLYYRFRVFSKYELYMELCLLDRLYGENVGCATMSDHDHEIFQNEFIRISTDCVKYLIESAKNNITYEE